MLTNEMSNILSPHHNFFPFFPITYRVVWSKDSNTIIITHCYSKILFKNFQLTITNTILKLYYIPNKND